MKGETTRKGIVLAGGSGSRLHPVTRVVSKQLLAVFDKPMIYYPLSTLMLAGIRDVLVVTTPRDRALYERLLGDGHAWGMSIAYAEQPEPRGLADALLVGRDFVAGAPCALVLGDNLFYGHGFHTLLLETAARAAGATVFGYWVKNPSDYGVAELDAAGSIIGIEEKPRVPKSHYAVTGLYFYDENAIPYAERLRPSPRGELEITDLNRAYLAEGTLRFEKLGRGIAWLDTGTPDALLQAANYVQAIQSRQGLQIACPEEIAFRKGWIDAAAVRSLAAPFAGTAYGEYLLELVATS